LNVKFKEDLATQEIHSGIYLIKNFFLFEDLEAYKKHLDQTYIWKDLHEEYKPGDLNSRYWNGKLSPDIIDVSFHSKLINLFSPTHWILGHFNFVRLIEGEQSTSCPKADPVFEYKVAIYFGEWDGGDIIFPKLDFKYSPKYGDMLIIKNEEDYEHITGVVKTGTRYAYQDYLIRHPGYFMP
jgi:hypothetical protein